MKELKVFGVAASARGQKCSQTGVAEVGGKGNGWAETHKLV